MGEEKKELISISFWKTAYITDDDAINVAQVVADVLGLEAGDIDMELDEND